MGKFLFIWRFRLFETISFAGFIGICEDWCLAWLSRDEKWYWISVVSWAVVNIIR